MTYTNIVPQQSEKSISSLGLNLHIFIPDDAFRSWIKSTRRLLKTLNCPICNRRAKCRGGFLLCNNCKRGWPLDEILDLINDIEDIGKSYKEVSKMKEHTQDSDCTLDPETNTCTSCGVYHGDPCPKCGGRGYHKPGCEAIDGKQ